MATEKKLMYMTYALETDPSICDVMAYVDNGKVMCYYHTDDPRDVSIPKECEHFFDSEEEARNYILNRIDYLRKKAEEVRDWMEEVGSYWYHYDCEHAVKLKDAIPWQASSVLDKDKDEWTIKALARCVRTQSVTIDGTTIPLSSISHIEWSTTVDTVVIIGGQRVVAKKYAEQHLLELIFKKD